MISTETELYRSVDLASVTQTFANWNKVETHSSRQYASSYGNNTGIILKLFLTCCTDSRVTNLWKAAHRDIQCGAVHWTK